MLYTIFHTLNASDVSMLSRHATSELVYHPQNRTKIHVRSLRSRVQDVRAHEDNSPDVTSIWA